MKCTFIYKCMVKSLQIIWQNGAQRLKEVNTLRKVYFISLICENIIWILFSLGKKEKV